MTPLERIAPAALGVSSATALAIGIAQLAVGQTRGAEADLGMALVGTLLLARVLSRARRRKDLSEFVSDELGPDSSSLWPAYKFGLICGGLGFAGLLIGISGLTGTLMHRSALAACLGFLAAAYWFWLTGKVFLAIWMQQRHGPSFRER
jgi:hypothetical protein